MSISKSFKSLKIILRPGPNEYTFEVFGIAAIQMLPFQVKPCLFWKKKKSQITFCMYYYSITQLGTKLDFLQSRP